MEADGEASQTFIQPDTQEWKLPSCWVYGASLIVQRNGVLLADAVAAIKAELRLCTRHAKDITQHQRAFQFGIDSRPRIPW